jgi:hypothetical protein
LVSSSHGGLCLESLLLDGLATTKCNIQLLYLPLVPRMCLNRFIWRRASNYIRIRHGNVCLPQTVWMWSLILLDLWFGITSKCESRTSQSGG